MKVSTGGERIRITELARSAGLSMQQIRNYVDLRVLPPAERAANGYRVFTTRHAQALATARTLIAGHGWPAATAMLRAVHDGDADTALALCDRSHADLDRERVHVRSMLDALDGDLPERFRIRRPQRIAETAAAARVRPSALRLWERRGLLSPDRERGTGYRLYDQAQFTRAGVIALLRRHGYSLAAVREVMAAMVAGDPARTREALASRQRDLNRASVLRAGATAALYGYLRYTGAVPDEP